MVIYPEIVAVDNKTNSKKVDLGMTRHIQEEEAHGLIEVRNQRQAYREVVAITKLRPSLARSF